ncbi:hypothetical protein JTB14_005009 [Gonioctena quinquepunctata]|nr:hypothetical protein JTB14_005009 [Gonioctena quinquepunctata]
MTVEMAQGFTHIAAWLKKKGYSVAEVKENRFAGSLGTFMRSIRISKRRENNHLQNYSDLISRKSKKCNGQVTCERKEKNNGKKILGSEPTLSRRRRTYGCRQ